jgi:threonine dehydrogenase-like Zn-dependent dehydrogenase
MAATDTDKEQLSMKALVYEGPGNYQSETNRIQPNPVVVVGVKAVGVCGSDVHGYTAQPDDGSRR